MKNDPNHEAAPAAHTFEPLDDRVMGDVAIEYDGDVVHLSGEIVFDLVRWYTDGICPVCLEREIAREDKICDQCLAAANEARRRQVSQ